MAGFYRKPGVAAMRKRGRTKAGTVFVAANVSSRRAVMLLNEMAAVCRRAATGKTIPRSDERGYGEDKSAL
jgi:hypothetical protein